MISSPAMQHESIPLILVGYYSTVFGLINSSKGIEDTHARLRWGQDFRRWRIIGRFTLGESLLGLLYGSGLTRDNFLEIISRLLACIY